MNPSTWSLAGVVAGVVALLGYLLFPSRKAIWQLLKLRLRGERVHTVRREEDGSLRGACPKCGASVVYSEIRTKTSAFRCEACGERGTWTEAP